MTSPLRNTPRLRLRHLPSIGCALLLCSLLTACTPGPKYRAPAPPPLAAKSYKESTVNFQDAEGWKVASPQDAMLHVNGGRSSTIPSSTDMKINLTSTTRTSSSSLRT